MAKSFVFSERDYEEYQRMIRWWRLNKNVHHRYRPRYRSAFLPSGPLDSFLKAQYLFNNNEAKDCSGNGNDGTYGGGMGSPRDVAEFDGADDVVDCGSIDFLGVGPITITGWLRLESGGEGLAGTVITNGKTVLQVEVWPAFRRLYFTSNASTTVSFTTDSLSLHKWYFVAVTRTATGAAVLYVNGVQDATGDSGTPEAGITNVCIGNNAATTSAFDGQMDDIRFYSKVLSAHEIRQAYEENNKNFLHANEVWGVKVFAVQHEATAGGDGIYDCYEQVLDATEWPDTAGDPKFDNLNTTEVEVLNLAESNPEATYVAHLAANDLLVAVFRGYDDEGNARWAGVPIRINNADRGRIAFCNGAPTGKTISAFLDRDTTGTAITVYTIVAQTGEMPNNTFDMDDVLPCLADGDPIEVKKHRFYDGAQVRDYWVCTTIFTPSLVCSNYSA